MLIPWFGAGRTHRGSGVPEDARSPGGAGMRDPPGPVDHRAGDPPKMAGLVPGVIVLSVIGVVLGRWIQKARGRAVAREQALLRRDRILAAIGSGAEWLVRGTDPRRLNEFLGRLGRATGVTRAYIFQNGRDASGELVASQRFEWTAPGIPPQIDNPELQGAAYDSHGMHRWKIVLGRGEAILGNVGDFPESEQPLLRAQGIRSLVVLPIFIGPEWWGFIGFDEIRWERWWSPAEVEALKASAALVAAVIERDRADERMRQLARARAERAAARAAEERSRFLAEASRILGSTLKHETIFEQLARLVVPALGDWCIIDVLEGDRVRRVAVAHADPRAEAMAARLREAVPPSGRGSPIAEVLETGQVRSVPRIDVGPIRDLGARPAIIVPLRTRGALTGALTILAAESRRYGPDDLALAETLAGRASLGLDNARLYAEAQRATRSRDEMLAVVSHDLRDPLNTISLALGMLEQTMPSVDETSRQQLDIIGRSVRRADRLIHDLLDVARLEAGRLRLDRRRISSREVASEAVESHRSQAQANGQELVGELPAGLPDIWADRDRLLQVFGNLLGNSIKFTPEHGRITVGAETQDGSVRFWVRDTGRGIPADQLPHLFDPFWQVGRRGEGAGLGLAIARGIVEAHGGRIRAESTVGVGTTISFTIPVAEGGERSAAEAVPLEGAPVDPHGRPPS